MLQVHISTFLQVLTIESVNDCSLSTTQGGGDPELAQVQHTEYRYRDET